jgi:glucose/mannose-6-phosphate isomerase
MLELIKNFPGQLREALQIGENAKLVAASAKGIQNIVVCGLGGSGIGGDLLAELLKDEVKVPILVNKGYFLPAYVSEHTLLILCSYSGNTEETVSCAQAALSKGLKPVCITSGGKLEEIANANGLPLIKIPGGHPPRACLGYSTIQLFYVLKYYGLISDAFVTLISDATSFLEKEQDAIKLQAELLSKQLVDKVIIGYAEDKYGSTVLRLKQQINENSKMTCWFNVFPELNHNELVGWRDTISNLAVLLFRTDDVFDRVAHRMDYTKDVIVGHLNSVHEVTAKGSNSFEKHFYLIHFGDWLSYHLALLHKVDVTEVNVITNLKKKLDSLS